MSENFIANVHSRLKGRHYVVKANMPNYFFNFWESKVKRYIERFGDDFMLVCWRSSDELDAYFIPFTEARKIFTQENINVQKKTNLTRWLGTIKDNMVQLGSNGRLDVQKFHNSVTSVDELV